MKRQRLCVVLVLFSLIVVGSVQARTLYWRDMRVRAELDADGRLHIEEQQTIVFDGAWNGGERRFHLRTGQQLHFNGLYRLDPLTAQKIPLIQGNLSLLDHWIWYTRDTLRWRARRAADPPFVHKAMTYILDYTLSGILMPLQGGYQLKHDFAFPDRDGVIQHFALDLDIDSSWQIKGELPTRVRQTNLAPGASVILSALLLHPDGIPAAVATGSAQKPSSHGADRLQRAGAPGWLRGGLLVLLWLLVVRQGLVFMHHERKHGRFKALLPPGEINTEWLDQHVFSFPPEVVGATWDKTTDASEVAAILARMVLEKKMVSRVEQEVFPWLGFKIPGMYTLYLQLLVPRASLPGYERELVEELFIEGDATDTKKVEKYYRGQRKTFDPVKKVSGPIAAKVKALVSTSKNPSEWIWVPTLILSALAFFLFFGDFFFYQYEHLQEFFVAGGIGIGWFIGLLFAAGYKTSADRVQGKAQLLWLGTILLVFFYTGIVLSLTFSIVLLLAGTIFCAAAVINILNVGKTRDSAEGVRLRRYLASARRVFKEELKKEKPILQDSWFPYLIAFGLGTNVDSWFRRYGAPYTTVGSSGSISPGGGSFTGGGGQFGGGGVSGAWSAAAGAISSSGGSSGGGGGFSGGGSGGGGGGGF